MAIITLADYRTLTNTDATDGYDAYITSLIPVVQASIEDYCDRKFDSDTYYEWYYFDTDRVTVLNQYPINHILYVGNPVNMANVSWSSGSYNIEITSSSVIVTNDSDFSQDEYLFADNSTITDLKTEIEDDYPAITVAIVSGYELTNTLLLRTGSGKAWSGASRFEAQVRPKDNSDRCIEFVTENSMFYFDSTYFDRKLFVMYQAGYAEDDMPSDLQMVEAMIIRDYINLFNTNINPLIKSQSITNYSVTYVDTDLLNNIVNNFASQLDGYKKKTT